MTVCDDEKEAVTLHGEIIKDSLQSCGIGYETTAYTYSSNLTPISTNLPGAAPNGQ